MAEDEVKGRYELLFALKAREEHIFWLKQSLKTSHTSCNILDTEWVYDHVGMKILNSYKARQNLVPNFKQLPSIRYDISIEGLL